MEEDHRMQQPLLSNVDHDFNPCILNNSELSDSEIKNGGDIRPINGVGDFFKEFNLESKKLWYLAAPAIFTSVSQYTIGALTQVFAGHLGTIQLAAISVENGVIAAFGYGILFGLGSALETLCGQAFGANHYGMLGIYLQRSWVILNTAAVFPIVFLFIFASPVLKFLGQTAEISKEAGKLALWMIPQQFAYAMIIPLSKFLQAQRKVMEMAVISGIALCLHTFLSWLLMMKLNWGMSGAAVVLNASWWFMALAQFLFVIAGFCGRSWSGFSWKALANLSEFVKLSVSSAVMLCLEIWYSIALTLFAGNLNDAEISVDALSIWNIMGWSSTIGVGFNVAISVRVSNELGSGHPRAAKFSVMVVVFTSLLVGLLFAFVLLFEQQRYPALFSTSTEVQQLVEELTPLLALAVILSCVQNTLCGVATGAGWQKFVAFLNTGCYFLFGVPFGILLCFQFDMGIKGLWYGMILGLCLQSLALFWVICITNWNREASSAEERLKLWGGESIVDDDEEK